MWEFTVSNTVGGGGGVPKHFIVLALHISEISDHQINANTGKSR